MGQDDKIVFFPSYLLDSFSFTLAPGRGQDMKSVCTPDCLPEISLTLHALKIDENLFFFFIITRKSCLMYELCIEIMSYVMSKLPEISFYRKNFRLPLIKLLYFAE